MRKAGSSTRTSGEVAQSTQEGGRENVPSLKSKFGKNQNPSQRDEESSYVPKKSTDKKRQRKKASSKEKNSTSRGQGGRLGKNPPEQHLRYVKKQDPHVQAKSGTNNQQRKGEKGRREKEAAKKVGANEVA